MSATPERREYAKERIRRLNSKLGHLYTAQPKTMAIFKSIKSCQQAVRRWQRILDGRI